MNKKYLVFGLMGLFAMAIVSAGLVNYLSNTVEEEITVDSPFSIDDVIGLDLEITHSGSDDFALVKITNNVERDIIANIELTTTGAFGYDTEGIAIAISDDINYCFSEQGDKSRVEDCEQDYMFWMEDNVAWNDWYANEAYNENVFFSDLVVNTDEDSFHALGYDGNKFTLPGLNFPAGETVYGVVYVTTNPALTSTVEGEPTTYRFDMTIVPTIA